MSKINQILGTVAILAMIAAALYTWELQLAAEAARAV